MLTSFMDFIKKMKFILINKNLLSKLLKIYFYTMINSLSSKYGKEFLRKIIIFVIRKQNFAFCDNFIISMCRVIQTFFL
jgi:hypothetical protein